MAVQSSVGPRIGVAERSIAEVPYIVDRSGETGIVDRNEAVFKQFFPDEPYVPWKALVDIGKNIEGIGLDLARNYQHSDNGIWCVDEIRDMLLKGYNPSARVYIRKTVEELVSLMPDNIKNERVLCGLEIGPGAGWSAAITYLTLKRQGFNRVTLHSVDKSVFALASTLQLAQHLGIPIKFANDGSSRQNWDEPDGIVLHLGDIRRVLSEELAQTSFHFGISDHGAAYMKQQDHRNMLELLSDRLIPGAVFITSSLARNIELKLNKFWILTQIFSGNIDVIDPVREERDDGLSVVTKLSGVAEAPFLRLLRELFLHNLSEYRRYKTALNISQAAQRSLRLQVETPSGDLKNPDNVPENLKWVDISGALRKLLPPFIETAALQRVVS